MEKIPFELKIRFVARVCWYTLASVYTKYNLVTFVVNASLRVLAFTITFIKIFFSEEIHNEKTSSSIKN